MFNRLWERWIENVNENSRENIRKGNPALLSRIQSPVHLVLTNQGKLHLLNSFSNAIILTLSYVHRTASTADKGKDKVKRKHKKNKKKDKKRDKDDAAHADGAANNHQDFLPPTSPPSSPIRLPSNETFKGKGKGKGKSSKKTGIKTKQKK